MQCKGFGLVLCGVFAILGHGLCSTSPADSSLFHARDEHSCLVISIFSFRSSLTRGPLQCQLQLVNLICWFLCKQDSTVVRSGRGTQQLPLRNPPTWRRLDEARETTNTTGTTTNREKQSTHKINEVRQCAYVLGVREKEILLIQQSIQLIQEGILEGTFRDTSGYNT